LSFRHADISLLGNSALPVALVRSLGVAHKDLPVRDQAFADWELDIPRLSGVFSTDWPELRCSQQSRPPAKTVYTSDSQGSTHPIDFAPSDYWHGNHAHMPGGGEMLLAGESTPRPSSGGPYRWVTSSLVGFSCLPSILNGSGEGFLAVAPDGTRYWFNWMAQYQEPELRKMRLLVPGSAENPLPNWIPVSGRISRKRNVLYATRIEDRFGNWVVYSYSNAANQPVRLDRISASDGRAITLAYNSSGYISGASDGTRIWGYEYNNGSLSSVVLPDSSRWILDLNGLTSAEIHYDGDLPQKQCGALIVYIGGGGIGRITHPSGAVGEFEVAPVHQGRSNVPRICENYTQPTNHPGDDVALFPRDYVLLGITRKKVTGPGLQPMEWSYGAGSVGSWIEGSGPYCNTLDCAAPKCLSDACAGTRATVVTGPGGQWLRYTFGNSYRYNEGKLLKVERGTSANNITTILRTETTTYELAQSGLPFPTPIGTSPQSRGDGFTAEYLRPQRSKVIAQDGATFNWTVASTCNGNNTYCFDRFARPTSVTKSNSLGHSKAEATEYHDDLGKWVLGQGRRQTTNGIEVARTDYDAATALPVRSHAFGKLQHTLAYHTDGTLRTVTDGRGHTTTLANWKRGIPQTITHPDGTYEAAAVDDRGWLAWVEDETRARTCYAYDAMGRITQVTYPSEAQAGVCDTSAWAATTQSFAPVAAVEYGIPAGHWTQTVSTGNARKVTYYDAFWRPLVEERYDAANPAATRSVAVKRYDVAGRLAFHSYPLASLTSYADTTLTGTRTFYDALDRMTRVEQDSELGVLATTTEYLPGFLRRTTSPRGVVTTERFQVFDVPGFEAPLQIDAAEGKPEQVRTLISRDVFGKPLDVARGEGG
jgi:hypothetical protein